MIDKELPQFRGRKDPQIHKGRYKDMPIRPGNTERITLREFIDRNRFMLVGISSSPATSIMIQSALRATRRITDPDIALTKQNVDHITDHLSTNRTDKHEYGEDLLTVIQGAENILFNSHSIYADGRGIYDLDGLEQLQSMRVISLAHNKITSIKDLPYRIQQKCPSFMENDLQLDLRCNPIDWNDTANRIAADTVADMGITLHLDESYLEAMHAKCTSAYDTLVRQGIPEEVIHGNKELLAIIKEAEREKLPSANTVFRIRDKYNRKLILKISSDKNKARLEAGANFYLSDRLSFIARGMWPFALTANGLYMTIQEDISANSKAKMSVLYWINTIAQFHRDAEGTLKDKGVNIPAAPKFRSVDDYAERYARTVKVNGIPYLDETRLKESLDILHNSQDRCLIHTDLKNDNLQGPYLIDLEGCCIGDPGIDLAMLLMQYRIPEKEWDSHLRAYLDTRGIRDPNRIRPLRESVQGAKYLVAVREILSSSGRSNTQQEIEKRQRLIKYIQSYR